MPEITGVLIGMDHVKAMIAATLPKAKARLRREMETQLVELQARVIRKLSDDVLHVRTDNLRSSINKRIVEDSDTVLRGQVGTNVRYARIHEYGGIFAQGASIHHWKKGPARGVARKASWPVRAHFITFPARSFLRTSLEERRPSIIAGFKRALADVAEGKA